MSKDTKLDPIPRCTVCATPLIEHGPELVCPQDGHRYIVKDGELIDTPRKGYGPGPDGVPDRRHYPGLDGGITRRTGPGANMIPRKDEPQQQPVPYR